MAARGAKGDPKLAALVRERQDLVSEWQKRDAGRSTAVAQAPEKRNREVEAENIARLTTIDRRIADIDKQLAANFPEYAVLASPAPLSVEEVQAQLLQMRRWCFFSIRLSGSPHRKKLFIWVVTKTDGRSGTPSLRTIFGRWSGAVA
jgi:hypothetical protein